ncbi:acetyl-CoA C-acetyltransferase [Aeromicrobium panaciterrae]|uniref:Acetyl-CoA C-acetyltransferase n=1 Tax=Aeromicrobium panaciterrae TaxID=363861 RepID=A0ABU1UPB5_9ACTN|nr:acetyl-CoA C-acetyltransferase [Aeromicrobium panaciterrae]MDR7087024.1 acetyl-CoA C-acetyltransferase [Aeromicrobium panaciterrae]
MAETPATKAPAKQTVRRVAVIGGNRIPFARSNSVYTNASNQEMLTAALDGLVTRYGLEGERVGEFAAGAVLKHSRDFNLARETVLGSKLSPDTPAFDVQQACDTGIQAAILVANKISLGKIESGIAGGTDTTSDAPLAIGDKLRKILLEANRAKDTKGRVAALLKVRPAHLAPDQPRNSEPRTGLSMGDSQAITTLEWGITREAQDELAATSHHNLAKSYDEGWQDDLVTPFLGVEKDNNLRPDSTVEKLAKLKPVFGRGEGATMTAGNSTPLSDGASAVLLASDDEAKKHGWTPLAYFVDYETAAVDYVSGAEGLLMAPAYAVPRMLERQGLTLQDFDFYEIHEAFAGQVLTTLAAWEDADFCKQKLGLDKPLGSIDRSKLNVKGSSLATAHPFAATGGRIVANLAKLLHEKGSGRGLISICAAGGQGVVAILEA